MIDYVNKDFFLQDSINKQWIITATKEENDETITVTTIGNEDLLTESISLTESLSSSDGLMFGRCESSRIEFTVYNAVASVKGCKLTVDIVLNNDTENPFRLGTYFVDSDRPTANRRHRKIVAYDRFYTLQDLDVKDWYNSLTFPITLKNFRDSFFNEIGITQEITTLPQDSISIPKTLDASESVPATSVLQCLCEINGAFGHMGRDDVFYYKYLSMITRAIYPSTDLYPAEDLYPSGWTIDFPLEKGNWSNAEYEDFECKSIDGVIIMGENSEIAAYTSQDPENPWVIENNFLTYDLNSAALTTMVNNVFPKVKGLIYSPSRIDAIGNPCLEVGDSFYFNDEYNIVVTYCLSRTLSGLQLLMDTLESSGEEDRSKMFNSISKQLARLKSKSQYDLDIERARIRNLEVDHVSVSQLNATNARVGSLEADHVSVASLNAVSGRVGTLEADHVSVSSFNALSASVNSLSAKSITTDNLSSKLANFYGSIGIHHVIGDSGSDILADRFNVYNGGSVYFYNSGNSAVVTLDYNKVKTILERI